MLHFSIRSVQSNATFVLMSTKPREQPDGSSWIFLDLDKLMTHFSILSTTNSPSPHHISLFSGGNVAHQNGANSLGNLYNNPIATEAQYMQQQGPN